MYNVWMYGCMDVWMYGCMDVWMYGCMYGCMDVCMDVCMYVCMYVCIYIYIYISVGLCIDVYIYIYDCLCMYSWWIMIMYDHVRVYWCVCMHVLQYKTLLITPKRHLGPWMIMMYSDYEAKSPFFGVFQREAWHSWLVEIQSKGDMFETVQTHEFKLFPMFGATAIARTGGILAFCVLGVVRMSAKMPKSVHGEGLC